MVNFNEIVSGQISTLLADLTPVHENTPSFLIDQKRSDILSGSLCDAQDDLHKNNRKGAKQKIKKALDTYHNMTNNGTYFSDDCNADVNLLEEYLRRFTA